MKLSKKLFKLLFSFTLTVLIVLFIALVFISTFFFSEQYRKNLNNTILQSAEQIDTYLYRIVELLVYPLYNSTLYTLLSTDVSGFSQTEIYNYRQQLSDYIYTNIELPLKSYFHDTSVQFAINTQYSAHTLYTDDAGGNIVSASLVENESWYKTDGIRTSVTQNGSDERIVQFSRTVYYIPSSSATNRMSLGVMKLAFPIDNFIQGLSQELQNRHNLLYLVTPSGYVYKLFGSSEADIGAEHLLSVSYDRYQSSQETQQIDGVIYFMSAAMLDQGWQLIGYSSFTQVIYSALPIYIAVLVIISLFILLSFFFSYKYVPKVICTPIYHLIDTMNKGDYSLIEEKSFYEMEVLNRAYNHFATHTQELIQKVIQENEKAKNAEIKALQAQINPHFMYNTLDSISWKVMEYDSEAPEIINKLSEILRYSISSPGKLVPLTDDLEIMKAFIDIEKFCYSFELELHTEDSHLFGTVYVPKLTLQPLAENAIRHAILDQDPPRGRIDVYTETDSEKLYLHVKNTGRPADIEKINQLLEKDDDDTKHGIRNINTRLKILYGPEYGLSYSLSENNETIATVILPLL